MNKTSNFTLALLALAGAAFAQNVNDTFPRGSLLRQNNAGGVPAETQQQLANQVGAADKLDFYKRGELIHRRSYQTCVEKESQKRDANPYNCQNQKNIANYYKGMAAAPQQPQVNQRNISSRRPPSSQLGQRLPQMRSYVPGRR